MERAKTILSETLFATSNGQSDLISLPGGRPLIADSLIYRLTFDPEDDDELDGYHDESQFFTHNQVKSIDHVWSSSSSSSNWNHQDDHYNINIEHGKPECPSMFKPLPTIKLNVSSLADEIIDSEMNSLKCLQNQSESTINEDHHHHYHQHSDNEGNDETIKVHDEAKSTGQCSRNGRTHMKSLILPSLMRGTINTESSIITYDCPPTRAFLSCCVIS